MVNWLDTWYLHQFPREVAAAISFGMPTRARQWIARRAARQIADTLALLQTRGARVLFYVHDLATFSRLRLIKEIDAACRPLIVELADAVLFAEHSAARAFLGGAQTRATPYISPLGDYQEYHGPAIDKRDAQRGLGIPINKTVVLAMGTLRPNRTVGGLFPYFEQSGDLHLLAAGRANVAYRGRNVDVFGGFVEDELMLRLISAADYVIHTGERYLTSAAVRVAMSYGLPAIARPFGATVDMARGALVQLPDADELSPEFFNSLPRSNTFAYLELSRNATQRGAERTWHLAAQSLASAMQLFDSAGGTDTLNQGCADSRERRLAPCRAVSMNISCGKNNVWT
jgi:hypothetical protein